jgi:7-cyano-7-deazaguanine reductase
MSVDLPLGREVPLPETYDPSVLVALPREEGRRALGLEGALPFDGVDLWNAHELAWLGPTGKPVVATAELWIPATSPRLVESKSLKLYLGSLSETTHASSEEVRTVVARDLEALVGAPVDVRLALSPTAAPVAAPPGTSIDDVDVACDVFEPEPGLLESAAAEDDQVDETLTSHLFKSNCPVTGQPDWATVLVRYRGGRIDRGALLRYLVSFRNHQAFHEHCVERLFVDLKARCRPTALTVLARYTRRGGIDINPFRSDFETLGVNAPAWRQ